MNSSESVSKLLFRQFSGELTVNGFQRDADVFLFGGYILKVLPDITATRTSIDVTLPAEDGQFGCEMLFGGFFHSVRKSVRLFSVTY